jgi:hypothetical protein
LKDYALLPKNVPGLLASLDTGHMATYGEPNAGKFGKAAVSFLEWQFRGVEKEKKKFLDRNSENSFVRDHWNISFKNW